MSKFFVEVLLPNALDKTFLYLAPNSTQIGDVVLVEFGRKKIWGVIFAIKVLKPNDLESKKIKEINEVHSHLKISQNQIKFIEAISSYNFANRGLILRSFIGILNSDKIKKNFSFLTQEVFPEKFSLKTLTANQQEIYKQISKDLNSSETFLIDGVTGSGKTEIYFAIIAEILTKNPQTQILILLPEIALTSQLVSRFNEQFHFQPAIWHSKISKKQKREIYFGITSNSVKVIIGARSALLLPFNNLRLIVIDEEHDPSFKQEDTFNFHARDMAIVKSKIENFPVVLSSATPALETYNNAETGKYKKFLLSQKFGSKNTIELIDLRQEKLEKDRFLSPKLCSEIIKNLDKGQQTLLFLNRRGYSPVTLCKSCGQKYGCQNCDFHLVFHKAKNLLACHHCGHEEEVKKKCKFCHEENSLISLGVGVEKIAEEVKNNFPKAKIILITSDNILNFNDAEQAVKKITNGEIDIIIGTQMISKGYDFPRLSLVGIVDADSMLYSSELRALERAFQVFTQVIGRAGRREEKGKILIQTYNPKNLLFEKIALDDKQSFYDFELENRHALDLPPFTQIVRFEISGTKEQETKNFAKTLLTHFPINDKIELFGPASAPIQKVKNRYNFLIHLKAQKRINLQKLIDDVIKEFKAPSKFRIKVNINPF